MDVSSSLQRERVTFFIGCVLAVCILLPLWRPLGAGLILGYYSEDVVAYLARRFHLGRWGRMLTSAALVGTVLLVFLIPLGLGIYKAGRELLQALRDSEGDLGLGAGPFSDAIGRWLSERLARWSLQLPANLLAELGPRLRQAALAGLAALTGWLRSLLFATPRALFDFVITVVTWWLAAVDGASQRERVLRWLLPWPEPRLILSRAVVEVLGGLIFANLAVAAVQATVCAAGLAIFGLPHVFSLGVLCFFLAFVPVVGTAAVTVSAAIYLLSHGRVGAGLLMLGLALFAGTIDNMLRPFFLRGRVELPVAWIFLSIMGGIAALGVAGIVIGPVALSICRAALLALEEKERAQAAAEKLAAEEAAVKEVR